MSCMHAHAGDCARARRRGCECVAAAQPNAESLMAGTAEAAANGAEPSSMQLLSQGTRGCLCMPTWRARGEATGSRVMRGLSAKGSRGHECEWNAVDRARRELVERSARGAPRSAWRSCSWPTTDDERQASSVQLEASRAWAKDVRLDGARQKRERKNGSWRCQK